MGFSRFYVNRGKVSEFLEKTNVCVAKSVNHKSKILFVIPPKKWYL
jgi:hypothetical protein